jgi:hypothetical protein
MQTIGKTENKLTFLQKPIVAIDSILAKELNWKPYILVGKPSTWMLDLFKIQH